MNEQQADRIALALESIADSLARLGNPVMLVNGKINADDRRTGQGSVLFNREVLDPAKPMRLVPRHDDLEPA